METIMFFLSVLLIIGVSLIPFTPVIMLIIVMNKSDDARIILCKNGMYVVQVGKFIFKKFPISFVDEISYLDKRMSNGLSPVYHDLDTAVSLYDKWVGYNKQDKLKRFDKVVK